MLIDSVLKEC